MSSENLDVIADPAREGDVLCALWDTLLADPSTWDCLRLTDLLEDSLLRTHWKPSALAQGFTVHVAPSQACPFLALSAFREEFRRGLGSSTRSKLRRAERIYKRQLIYYGSGFDPEPLVDGPRAGDYSPGFVLVGRCIEDGIRRSLDELNFLRGLETYKSLWTRTSRETRTLMMIPPRRWRALAVHAAGPALLASKRSSAS